MAITLTFPTVDAAVAALNQSDPHEAQALRIEVSRLRAQHAIDQQIGVVAGSGDHRAVAQRGLGAIGDAVACGVHRVDQRSAAKGAFGQRGQVVHPAVVGAHIAPAYDDQIGRWPA